MREVDEKEVELCHRSDKINREHMEHYFVIVNF